MSKFVKQVFSVFITGIMVLGSSSAVVYADDASTQEKPTIESIDAIQNENGTVTFTVNAQGGNFGNGCLFYKFYQVDDNGNKVPVNQNKGIGQNYSLDNTYTCDATDGVAKVYAEVEDSNNATDEMEKEFNVSESQNQEKKLQITDFTNDVDENTTEDSQVTLKAIVDKQNVDGVTYNFIAIDSYNNRIVIKEGNSSIAKWTPGVSGDYTLKLIVSDSTGELQDSKEEQVTINDNSEEKPEPSNPGQDNTDQQNNQELSVQLKIQNGTYYVNEPILLKANANGGQGQLTYRFAYDSDRESDTIQAYSQNDQAEFTPSEAGNYKLYVYVKDETGKRVESKEVNIVVQNKQENQQGDTNQNGSTDNQDSNANSESQNGDQNKTGDLSKGILPIAAACAASFSYIAINKKKKNN